MPKKTSKLIYKSPYLDETVHVTFLCNCGCTEFEREPWQANFSFVEGFYNCSACNAEHDYCSSNFLRNYHPHNKPQLTLF